MLSILRLEERSQDVAALYLIFLLYFTFIPKSKHSLILVWLSNQYKQSFLVRVEVCSFLFHISYFFGDGWETRIICWLVFCKAFQERCQIIEIALWQVNVYQTRSYSLSKMFFSYSLSNSACVLFVLLSSWSLESLFLKVSLVGFSFCF